ncbi:MAG TPA: TlpA family protein disulfide reductase [Candidatus Cybelea sp.]|jgi:thiol-disulfide isomerase/thioredoxin
MTRRPILLATAAIVVVIAVAALLVYNAGSSHGSVQTASQAPIVGKAALNQTAPPFEVSTTAGLFDLRKTQKPVFLEVFATWCPHCQRMTSVVDRLYAAYHKRVDFVAVSGSDTAMDGTSSSSQRDVLDWVKRFDVKYPVGYDPILNVANLYLQGGFPTFAVIGSDKKIRYLADGEISYNDLQNGLKKVLR